MMTEPTSPELRLLDGAESFEHLDELKNQLWMIPDSGLVAMKIGVRNATGDIIFIVTIRGLKPYIGLTTWFSKKGYHDELANNQEIKDGCHAIFSKGAS